MMDQDLGTAAIVTDVVDVVAGDHTTTVKSQMAEDVDGEMVMPRLRFQYLDLTIHMSRQAMHDLVSALNDRQQSIIITANIDVHSTHVDFSQYGQRILYTPNAGGPSIMSEALSAEIMDRILGIRRIFTECEVQYSKSKQRAMTDYACHLSLKGGGGLGVSVTRAIVHRGRLSSKAAKRLVTKKAVGILKSTDAVVNCSFQRQVLHIWVPNGTDSAIVRRACSKLTPALKSNTIFFITTVNMSNVFSA